MVLKTLDLLSTRRALGAGEDVGLESGGGGSGGGRRNRMEISHPFSCIDSISESHNIELREDDDDDNDTRRKSIKYVIHERFSQPLQYNVCHTASGAPQHYTRKTVICAFTA